jgi:hypothetical protein
MIPWLQVIRLLQPMDARCMYYAFVAQLAVHLICNQGV